ncbi:glycosyltransferase [Alterinioella nitratireducens]|uniref:glycosyltransferase n=1 Tax=Alterinioella nitratireducens TaxID=2735915 RepID=UPI002E29972D|nr:glycosyltransferase [Alterinioella nitratireducens]
MTEHVTIVMAVYDGAEFLAAQMESFAGQTHRDWDLVISDDGSTDDSDKVIAEFAATHPVRVMAGPRAGGTMNFLSALVGIEGEPDYVAFSDQDDVWLPERLAHGIAALASVPADRPALYGSATWIVEEDLTNPRRSPTFPHPPAFRNALVQSIAGGNTMLLNRPAWEMARDAAGEAMAVGGPYMHDWWLYQLISGAGGTVLRDNRPTLLYRQHGGNIFGTNRGRKAIKARLKQVWRGDLKAWVDANIRALDASRHRLTEENQRLLAAFVDMRRAGLLSRLRGFAGLGLWRQGRVGQAMLWLAVLLKKL